MFGMDRNWGWDGIVRREGCEGGGVGEMERGREAGRAKRRKERSVIHTRTPGDPPRSTTYVHNPSPILTILNYFHQRNQPVRSTNTYEVADPCLEHGA